MNFFIFKNKGRIYRTKVLLIGEDQRYMNKFI